MRRALLLVAVLLLLTGVLAATGQSLTDEHRIVGARRALPAGTRITLGDVTAIEPPEGLAPDKGVRLERASSVIGGTLKRDVGAGAPITVDDVGFLQRPGAGPSRPRLGQRPGAAPRRLRGARRRARRTRR